MKLTRPNFLRSSLHADHHHHYGQHVAAEANSGVVEDIFTACRTICARKGVIKFYTILLTKNILIFSFRIVPQKLVSFLLWKLYNHFFSSILPIFLFVSYFIDCVLKSASFINAVNVTILQVRKEEVVLEGVDVHSALIDYINHNSVTNIVLGASTKNVITRYR